MAVKWEEKQEDGDNFTSGSSDDSNTSTSGLRSSNLRVTKCTEATDQDTNHIRRKNGKVISPSLKVFKVHLCRVTDKPTEA